MGGAHTIRGLRERGTTRSHCLHAMVVALAKSGMPQLQSTISEVCLAGARE